MPGSVRYQKYGFRSGPDDTIHFREDKKVYLVYRLPLNVRLSPLCPNRATLSQCARKVTHSLNLQLIERETTEAQMTIEVRDFMDHLRMRGR